MNERVDRLELLAEKTAERLFALERDVAIIKANGATKVDLAELESGLKSDIADAKSSVIVWVVSAIFLAQILPSLLKHFGF
jgi:hypothetical protein